VLGALVLARAFVAQAHERGLTDQMAPRARLALGAAGRWLQIAGTALPLATLALAVLVSGAWAWPLLAVAGALVAAAGAWFKFALVTRAGFNQGFALKHLPVRGAAR
jgi:phenylacetyl-CoA:acceptor oxidoreductase subunit 2